MKEEKIKKMKQSTTIASSVTKEMEVGITIVTQVVGMHQDMGMVKS